jgi:AcrR family transcriptional regulator
MPLMIGHDHPEVTRETMAARESAAATVASLDDSSRAVRTRRRIHDAARRAFAEQGTAVQIDDVIRRASIARGTFYNYFRTVDELFEEVAAEMARDLGERIYAGNVDIPDPALRVSNGLRDFCMQAHTDRDWGLFLAHFGLSTEVLQRSVRETGLRDIEDGIGSGRFAIRPDQATSALAILTGAVLASIKLVVAGMETPVRAGENLAEMGLRALGVEADEAEELARAPLTPLGE